MGGNDSLSLPLSLLRFPLLRRDYPLRVIGNVDSSPLLKEPESLLFAGDLVQPLLHRCRVLQEKKLEEIEEISHSSEKMYEVIPLAEEVEVSPRAVGWPLEQIS